MSTILLCQRCRRLPGLGAIHTRPELCTRLDQPPEVVKGKTIPITPLPVAAGKNFSRILEL